MSRFDRRLFLVGAGTTVALPFLEIMQPRVARAQSIPEKRLVVFYVPNGINMRTFTPAEAGASYALSPTLMPLADLKSEFTVFSGLANRAGEPATVGDHGSGTGAFLTCTKVTPGRTVNNGVSMDQLAVPAIGTGTLFPSLQLGAAGGGTTGECDSPYSCAYTRSISWAPDSTPLPKEVSPVAAFERLFSGRDPGESAEAAAKRKIYRLSVLDYVRESANDLKRKLGRGDQKRLDEYLTSVRELEGRVVALDATPSCVGEQPRPPENFQALVRAMIDVMVLAMRCDFTRVITFMMENALNDRVYDFLGISDGHHEISHHQQNETRLGELAVIDRWEVEQFAYLLTQMKNAPDSEGSLLDNSLVMFSSEVADGDRHWHHDLPVILAGRGGGIHRPGRHVQMEETPIANLYLAMLQGLGSPITTFGADGLTPLALT